MEAPDWTALPSSALAVMASFLSENELQSLQQTCRRFSQLERFAKVSCDASIAEQAVKELAALKLVDGLIICQRTKFDCFRQEPFSRSYTFKVRLEGGCEH
jgi:hypothetical protein